MLGAFNKLRDMASKIFPSSRQLEHEHVSAHRAFRWSRSPYKEQMPWSHLQFLVDSLEKKREAGILCDTHLYTGGKVVFAHRAVLATQSGYFAERCGESNDFSEPLVIDLGASFSSAPAVEALVKYMYIGKIEITMETLPDILSGMRLFQLDYIMSHCSEFMVQNITPLSCIHLYHLAYMYDMPKLSGVCKAIAKFRFHDVIQYRDEVLTVSSSFLRNILQDGVMETLHLEELLSLFLRWMNHQPGSRPKDCAQLLHTIQRVKKFSSNQHASFPSLRASNVTHPEVKRAIEGRLKEIAEEKEKAVPREAENVLMTCKSLIPHHGRMFVALEHVVIHAYRPLVDRWVTLELRLPKELEITSFRGCVRSQLFFKAYHTDKPKVDELPDSEEVILYDVATAKFENVPDPFAAFSKDLRHGPSLQGIRRTFISYSKVLTCIVGNYEAPEPFETWPSQLVLVYHKHRWQKIAELPRSRQSGYYVWLEHRGEMFILNSRSAEKGVWCKISADGDTFKVTNLASPPYGVHPDNYGMELIHDGEAILVGEVYRSYDMQHTYHIAKNVWFDITRPPARVRRSMLPIKETERMRKMTGVNMSPDLNGDGTDITWMWALQQICPYGSVLKRCIPETVPHVPTARNEDQRSENCPWVQHCSPCTEKLLKIQASRISSLALSYFQLAEYKDFTDEDGFGRLRKSGLLNPEQHASVTSSANVFLDFDDDI